MPRAVLNGELMELLDIGVLPREGSFDVRTRQAGEWGLVVEGQVPRFRLNLRTANATWLSAEQNPPERDVPQVSMNERWAVVSSDRGFPRFRVDLVSPAVERLDFGPAAPLRVLGNQCPKPATLPLIRDDGGIAVALRDDTGAAAYVGQPNLFPWTRVGLPVASIVLLGIDPRSGAWILNTDSGPGDLCPPTGWPEVEDLPEGTLHGDTVQIVMDQNVVVFEEHAVREFVFHETGLCGFVRGFVHDFPTGTRTALPADATHVMFW
jgi:hypothetical protein